MSEIINSKSIQPSRIPPSKLDNSKDEKNEDEILISKLKDLNNIITKSAGYFSLLISLFRLLPF